jgi:aspartyl-tRNA(Asn)/glutamyl-tRNA(Gln) amidotransferase subunit C
MQIDEKTVHKIAHLARLEIKEAQIQGVQQSLTQILNWVEQLNEVDTSKVEPLFSVHLHEMPQRQDVINDGNYVDAILANAPEADLGMFAVPKVVE